MNKKRFLQEFIEELGIEQNNVNLDTELISLDIWDSMSIMITTAFISENFDVNLTNDDFEHFKTIKDIADSAGIN